MAQIKNIATLLVIAVLLENCPTLGNPLVFKSLQPVTRENRKSDGSAQCKKVCPESDELDWLFDWFFYDDDEDNCFFKCNITISDVLKQSFNNSQLTTISPTTKKPTSN